MPSPGDLYSSPRPSWPGVTVWAWVRLRGSETCRISWSPARCATRPTSDACSRPGGCTASGRAAGTRITSYRHPKSAHQRLSRYMPTVRRRFAPRTLGGGPPRPEGGKTTTQGRVPGPKGVWSNDLETGRGLNFGLIHPCSPPFTNGHPDLVWAVRGRWRTPVNAIQHCWKACWGQPLASSNLASSATLTCDDALGSCSRAALIRTACVSFLSQFESWPYALFRDKSVWWHAEMAHVVPGQGRRGRA